MGWVRLDDQFADHPKVQAAGPAAAWLYVCALTYANRFLTDGYISPGSLRKLAPHLRGASHSVERLVDAGLWDIVEGGYQIHDYLQYQPSAAKIREEREAAKTRMQLLRSNGVRPKFGRTSNEVRKKFADPNPTQPETVVVVEEIPLSPEAREVVEAWRAAHGKRRPPKLNPALRTALEQAVQDLGVTRLVEAAEWSARNEVPEFIKAIRGAYTRRQQEDEAAERARPAARSGMARDSRNPRDYFAAAKR